MSEHHGKKNYSHKTFWYSDILVIPKVVTIITTVNKQGIVNAAPYSLFVPYDIMHNRPQVMVGMRKFSHTYKNIVATGEFVVNFPSADHLDDVMETSRFYRDGLSELSHTRFTSIASQKVAPPSLKECRSTSNARSTKTLRLVRRRQRLSAISRPSSLMRNWFL